ncbi:bifunctional acetate--CoA ligase family protein/GNAT family N-acetyltransferase [Rhodospirillaceae bacterium KN72]|uniref:Bifunctional acetate--CoA ligase family protein/GNAT family N-acetyltransferase n=1 Tax=Pacificispira spongiicola TaxID=2729598 RepID=A0A7Y0E272_9PROT|nr:bifunctional acetate--CoA ligase family protein/GNAT family N-acetyltransferase [Pacificispira spongiicola]NMM45836.1 bifunctional acetate--CoA ligase family protein/GNAT family N-acetyltransferase [Pacificispira spongiicola]
MSVRDLDSLFKPTSIALIGASKKPGSVGAVLAHNLFSCGFDGPIMPVNPHESAIGGSLAWPDIASLPIAPDLAVVATPPDTVPGVVADLRDKGCKSVCVITAGFGEGDDAEGLARRVKLEEAAGPMRILGPNVLGLMVPGVGLNASFAHISPLPGDLAFVAQSGAMLTSVLDWATGKGIGFSHLVSLGDKVDVDFGDMLNYLAVAPEVRAILLYVEAIGDAAKFMSAARAAARTKPVVAIKAGRVAEGAKAASSHTGALAGSDTVYDAAFRRAGMLRVYDMQELFDAVQTLSSSLRRLGVEGDGRPESVGDRLAILSNGGGIGVLATDSLIEQGGHLSDLEPETLEKLNGVLPPTWSKGNPIDIIGDAPPSRYADALEVLLKDKHSDAVLVLNCPTAISDSDAIAARVLEVAAGKSKPILTSWIGEGAAANARRRFTEAKVPTYNTAEEAVRGFMHVVRYRKNQANLMQVPVSRGDNGGEPDRATVRALIDTALAEKRAWLSEVEAKQVLDAYQIPIASSKVAKTPAEARQLASKFSMGDLVAVKILSPDITHKSDVGGVVLNLSSPDQVEEATKHMLERLRRDFPDAQIDGVSVQQMIRRPGAHELIVGLSEDPQFGPVVLFGKGGKEVEVVGDTVTGLPPLDDVLAQSLIRETAVNKLLRGYRDEPAADFEGIRHALIQVGRLAIDFAEIKELDINPLIADSQGVVALDARIRVAPVSGKLAEDPSSRLSIRPYPRELEGTVSLLDGRAIAVRPIRPEDSTGLQELVARSAQEDIRFRFLHPMKDLPERLANRLSQIDYAREMAMVALDPEDGKSLIGVARLTADADGAEAEYAILLRQDHKGEGLGYALMTRLIEFARMRGIGVIYGDVLCENGPMLSMCRDLGFTAKSHEDDPGVMRVSLPL